MKDTNKYAFLKNILTVKYVCTNEHKKKIKSYEKYAA
jgi:hypothetical protein